MAIALFVTCLADTLFPRAGIATVQVLERLGVEVDFPSAQTCCGQMHFNSGYRREAAQLAAGFAETFAGYEAVVSPSASCAAMVRHHYRRIDPDLVTPPVHELTEYLVDVLGVTDVGAYFPHRVVLHQTCHSLRLLRIGDRPRQLLAAVTGLELADPTHPDQCCGFGGTFAVKNPDTSAAMGTDKLNDLTTAGAEVVTSTDASCLMHLGGLAARRGGGPRFMHLAEILAATR